MILILCYSADIAPYGLDRELFLNVMAQVVQQSQWSAEDIIAAFHKNEGHWASIPGVHPKPQDGCVLS